MKKFTQAAILMCVIFLGSCTTIEQIPIDYLVPADVSFPSQIRRVGIVNNVSDFSDTQLVETDTVLRPNEIARKVTYYLGDAQAATESLAEAIAAENYFDLVAINDSALRASDINPRENTLSQTEIQELTEDMDVDMIIAFESLLIRSTRLVQFLPDLGMFWGTVDAKVFPSLKVYIPTRTIPLLAVNAQDSIFWEDLRYTESHLKASGVISDEDLVKEASVFAGTVPVKHIIPSWTSDDRYIYSGGSADMRDAAIYARENSWDKAYELWYRIYESNKGKKKMRAAFNIALSYEMRDDMEQAYEWAEKALLLAKEIEKVTDISKIADSSNYKFIANYLLKLSVRKENASKLMMQMDRF